MDVGGQSSFDHVLAKSELQNFRVRSWSVILGFGMEWGVNHLLPCTG